MPYVKPFHEEWKALRNKAIELRAFTADQDRDLKRRYTNGEKVKDLAAEFKVGKDAVYKAIRRA